MKTSILWLFPLLLLKSSSWALTELRTASQIAFPKYYLQEGKVSGICPAMLRAIEKTDPTIRFTGIDRFFPTKRIDQDLRQGRLDAFACFAPTSERKQYMDFIEPPLFTDRVSVAVRKSSAAAFAKSWNEMKDNTKWIFIATMGTPHPEFLKATPGLKVDAGSGDNNSNIIKLSLGRGDVFMHFHYILKALIEKEKLSDQLIILPFEVRREGQYMVVSKKTATSAKSQLQEAIRKLQAQGELQKIHDQYIDGK